MIRPRLRAGGDDRNVEGGDDANAWEHDGEWWRWEGGVAPPREVSERR